MIGFVMTTSLSQLKIAQLRSKNKWTLVLEIKFSSYLVKSIGKNYIIAHANPLAQCLKRLIFPN